MRVDDSQDEILRYFSLSFMMLGYRHVVGVPERVLDIALPGLVELGHKWNERHDGPWEVVHDQSSNMAKQKWMWDVYSSPILHPTGPKAVSEGVKFDVRILFFATPILAVNDLGFRRVQFQATVCEASYPGPACTSDTYDHTAGAGIYFSALSGIGG